MKLEVKFRFICHQISFALQKFDSAKILSRSADKKLKKFEKIKKDAKTELRLGQIRKRTSVAEVRMFSRKGTGGFD